MRSYFVPKPPDESVTDVRPQRADLHRHAVHRAQRVFLALNAVPFAVGVVLSCAAELAAAPVYGRLTLGLGWGVLQLGVFAGSVWWYENRATRVCDPLERPPTPGASGASPADASRAVTR
ncbi:hypothetical protein [Streptomyces ochraceiscleroticus]|uniref:DUF485 domain-containing protein n=1 Tax=Streptomyces ochraceiscleroticus TaxID=47761 RepID=A0ABW1MJQ5_9ACTN|nr:hypothetical protein [Streptomyces ochraceiscleroticus]